MWLPMVDCPRARKVLVHDIYKRSCIAMRSGDEIVDGWAGKALERYVGWLPIPVWRTDSAPRTGEWLLVTWGNGERVKVQWHKSVAKWIKHSGEFLDETWFAWTYDLPNFVPLKPSEQPNDLADKSNEDLAKEIARLADELARRK